MSRHFLRVLPLLLVAVWPPQAADTQQSVYGPPAPENAAFVRILHAAAGQSGLRLGIGAALFGPLEFGQVSPYRPVAADIYIVRAAGKQVTVTAQPGVYYTVAVTKEAIFFLEDRTHLDPSRAQLYLYNFSFLPDLALKTADGKTQVIGPVRPGGSGTVAVNPIRVRFGVFSRGTLIGEVADLGLDRGASYSVFVTGQGSGITVFWAQAEVALEP
jgi:alginate O-acetyltransferase complex protein AlgF